LKIAARDRGESVYLVVRGKREPGHPRGMNGEGISRGRLYEFASLFSLNISISAMFVVTLARRRMGYKKRGEKWGYSLPGVSSLS